MARKLDEEEAAESSRPVSRKERRNDFGTETKATADKPSLRGSIYATNETFSAEALAMGIWKTVSVQVIEEDITDADTSTVPTGVVVENDPDTWKDILKNGPPR
jgi:hypothetical protein